MVKRISVSLSSLFSKTSISAAIIVFLVSLLLLNGCGDGSPAQSPAAASPAPPTQPSLAVNTTYAPPVDEGCKCPQEINYVCGSDGRRYLNPCEAECNKITYRAGECNTQLDDLQLFPCGKTSGGLSGTYNPVCGRITYTDGSFYQWQTFQSAQTACDFREMKKEVLEYTRGECR